MKQQESQQSSSAFSIIPAKKLLQHVQKQQELQQQQSACQTWQDQINQAVQLSNSTESEAESSSFISAASLLQKEESIRKLIMNAQIYEEDYKTSKEKLEDLTAKVINLQRNLSFTAPYRRNAVVYSDQEQLKISLMFTDGAQWERRDNTIVITTTTSSTFPTIFCILLHNPISPPYVTIILNVIIKLLSLCFVFLLLDCFVLLFFFSGLV